ncbi:MAG: AMP-binding protein [Thermoplasmatota archaeon]
MARGEVPPEVQTVHDLVAFRANHDPSAPCFRFKGKNFTYGAVQTEATRRAIGLAERGVHKGDRVALLMANSPEFLFTWFAVARLGAVLVPLNPALRKEALAYSISDSGSAVVIADEEVIPSVLEVAPHVADLRSVVFVPPWAPGPRAAATPPPRQPPRVHLESVEALRSTSAKSIDAAVGPADPMCILYTSGTTGMPKGVVLPNFSYISTGREFRALVDLQPEDRPFTTLPLFHVNAQQTTTMGSMLAGVEFVLETKFSASAFWDLIRQNEATIFNYIGSIIPILYKAPPRNDDAENPARLGIGAACPRDLWSAFESRFGVTLLEGYGLTETGTVATCSRPDAVRIGAIGRPISFAEVAVVDAMDRPVPAGTIGEIVVRPRIPYTMMLEYWKKPEATVEAWRNLWFHTGDLGRVDEEGFFYFVDRAKDCIRRRGENISSFLVQKILLNHPDIVDCAAFAVPSDFRDGEDEVKVDLVLRPGANVREPEIATYCNEAMPGFMVPRYIQIRDSLPKTETERVQKFKLRSEGVASAWDRAAHERAVPAPTGKEPAAPATRGGAR